MIDYRYYFLFLFCCIAVSGQAQTVTVSGKITSKTTQEEVLGASVVVKNNAKIIGFGYTNNQGVYSIKFDKQNFSQVIVEVQSLGFLSDRFDLLLETDQSSYTVNFSLDESIEELSVVVLKPEERIKINRDTISYRLSAFKDGSERTVEDMLKNLPGIEVSDNGNISALGRPIQKILIEGDDLADTNYKVISKNLDVNVLDAIEIISNYEENPVLKQFLESENVVLNLKLKDSKKAVLFGKAEAGAGIENRYLGDLNLGIITPGVKLLDLANINNTGNPAGNQFANYNFVYTGFNDFNQDVSIAQNPVVFLEGSSIEIEDKNYIENRSWSNNLLANKRFSEKLQLRNSFYIYSDDFEKQYFGNYRYFVEPENIFFSEANHFNMDNINASNDLSLSFAPSENTYLTFDNTISLFNESKQNLLVFNDSDIEQFLKNKNKEFETKIQFTKKTKSGAAVINAYMGSKNLNQQFTIIPDTFSEETNADTNIKSRYENTLDYQGIDASLIYKRGKTALSITSGVQHFTETLNMEAFASQGTNSFFIDSLSGNNNARNIESHLRFKMEYELMKNFFINTNIAVKSNLYKRNDYTDTFFLPNPHVSLQLRKTKTGTYRLGYEFSSEIPRLEHLSENFLLTSYRRISLGAETVEPINRHRYYFSHNFSNVRKHIMFNSSIAYTRFENQLSFRNLLTQDTDVNQKVYMPAQDLLMFNTGITTYINPLNMSIKFGYQQLFSSQQVFINDAETILKNNTSSYYVTGTTYLRGVINFRFLSNYTINVGTNENFSIKNERYRFELKTVLKFSTNWIANIESKSYIIGSEFYEVNNAEIEYRPKEKGWVIGLRFQNLLNNKAYIFENATDFIQATTVFTSVPRYGLVYYTFRF